MGGVEQARYGESLTGGVRRPTRAVHVGEVAIGGPNPVRVQSMTTTTPDELAESLSQVEAIVAAGGELVRLTTPQVRHAEAMGQLRNTLAERGVSVPLVADVHFSPVVARAVAQYADKVRINPGNYGPTEACKTPLDYSRAIEAVRSELAPLVEICRARGVALRIGVNHGSLAPRIVGRFGAGAKGMVKAALESITLCRELDFHNLVVSLKASEVRLMVSANRLLCSEMRRLGWDYPIHLGVTEAGNELEGRIKSATGIGSLLLDGIGDTLRVSLTESPAHEITFGRELLARCNALAGEEKTPWPEQLRWDPYNALPPPYPAGSLIHKRGHGLLLVSLERLEEEGLGETLRSLGFLEDADGGYRAGVEAVDGVLLSHGAEHVPPSLAGWFATKGEGSAEWVTLDGSWRAREASYNDDLDRLNPDALILLHLDGHPLSTGRLAAQRWRERGYSNPVILASSLVKGEGYALEATLRYGPLLVDYLAAGLLMPSGAPLGQQQEVGLTLLQTVGMRRSRVEVVSCPGCGRTLYNLEGTTAKVKAALRGRSDLKVAVMGCIVNGPGEMADAHYGYVGAGPGKISLYRHGVCVQKGIPESHALEALVVLIEGDKGGER